MDIMIDNFTHYSLNKILRKTEYSRKNRRTKIVCTIGPSCWDVDKLVKMLDYGMDVARLNFSHGDHQSHAKVCDNLREAMKQQSRQDSFCALMLDTKGPEIRTGLLKDHMSVLLKKNQELIITTDYAVEGDTTVIACSYAKLPQSVKLGQQILIADGSIVCVVSEIMEQSVKVTVKNGAFLGERKNMNLPGISIDLPTLTEQDISDIKDFGLVQGIDMIALSFTRSKDDILNVRKLLGEQHKHIKIIAKIENHEGLINFDEILQQANGIMIARGDLGMEIAPEKVFVAQKWMIQKANEAGKPIITATQMMESMISNPRPTRAEASDVANAVLDGTDAVMLSGETANGAYPFMALETMDEICQEAELCYDYESQFIYRQSHRMHTILGDIEAVAACTVQLSFEMEINCIIAFTESGKIVEFISKHRPKAMVIAVGYFESVVKGLQICRGVSGVNVPNNSQQSLDQLIQAVISKTKNEGYCEAGDKIIICLGNTEYQPDVNKHLAIKIMTVT